MHVKGQNYYQVLTGQGASNVVVEAPTTQCPTPVWIVMRAHPLVLYMETGKSASNVQAEAPSKLCQTPLWTARHAILRVPYNVENGFDASNVTDVVDITHITQQNEYDE
jgi:hypothetical protein